MSDMKQEPRPLSNDCPCPACVHMRAHTAVAQADGDDGLFKDAASEAFTRTAEPVFIKGGPKSATSFANPASQPERLLQFFDDVLADRRTPIHTLYWHLAKRICDTLAPSAERTLALRSLLASRDDALRAESQR